MPVPSSTSKPDVGVDAPSAPAPGRRPGRRPAPADPRPKRQPPHGVVLHNDDVNGFDFVISCLRRVFGYSAPRAFLLTMQAHASGRSLVWTGMKEHAEFKAERLVACGPDPVMKSRGAQPLGVSVVPLDD